MLSSFFIRGFRGIGEQRLVLGEKTAIIGKNGSGKTHILEGIHISSGGSQSYLQAPRKEDAFFELGFVGDIGTKQFSLARQDDKDIYQIQGKKSTGIKYRTELPYRTVFISPFDMNLLYFAPGARRDAMDSILSRTFGQFSKVKRDYDGTMRQRNALLKRIRDGEADRQDLDYWDASFAEKASLYHLYRKKWCDFVTEQSEVLQKAIGKYEVRFSYISRIEEQSTLSGASETPEMILRFLTEQREHDILTGHTHIGPHLDDFAFLVKNEGTWIESAYYLSRGENKVLLFALKQIEMFFLKKYLDLPIVLLFDDILAELDDERAESILHYFAADQLIVSSPRALPKSKNWDDFSCINLDPV